METKGIRKLSEQIITDSQNFVILTSFFGLSLSR